MSDNIEGLANFAAFKDAQAAGTVTLVAAKTGLAPVVESVILGLTGGDDAASCKIQVVNPALQVGSPPASGVIDQISVVAAASAEEPLGATRVKMKAVSGCYVQAVVAGTNAACDIHVDGRWIGGDGPNFS